jgi:hypothetical protein
MVFLIFGILGTNLIGGKLGQCSAGGREDGIITKASPAPSPSRQPPLTRL